MQKEEIRNNDTVIIDDKDLAVLLWDRIKGELPEKFFLPMKKMIQKLLVFLTTSVFTDMTKDKDLFGIMMDMNMVQWFIQTIKTSPKQK